MKYTKDKVLRLQVKFKELEDIRRKLIIDEISRNMGVSSSALILDEIRQMLKETE
jgi:hypothetical protein